MTKYLVVVLGAGLGGLARFAFATWITHRFRTRFPPLGTVAVNVTGCFLIGVIMTVLLERFPERLNWRYFLVTGVLGGYTTFSSFEYESVIALRVNDWPVALANLVGSVVLGFAGTWLGVILASRR